ncbi:MULTISPECIES: hypothetical protein [unclassified Butyrivibrio]|uniref:hypothetical protein n=1 Tax=unclassified Butyrivibrio TaxID=2639466 RepID=UPI000876ABCE|nr:MULTISPECIES: hypothetical protein [unclassified Butyrivibrio]SCY14724.1 hypothetical protein SAMN02910371_01218 [Butyrivibrio sp. INlla14]SDB52140.1 hypothetical protein SAMN02910263_02634 [Butyrivibrio sp. INlla16]
MEEVVDEVRVRGSVEHCNRVLRKVRLCCGKCKKAFPMKYTEVGNSKIVAFRNVDFKCERCSREKHIDVITEGALLKTVTVWNAVYI